MPRRWSAGPLFIIIALVMAIAAASAVLALVLRIMTVDVKEVAPGLFVLETPAGNSVLLNTEDGSLLIDPQFWKFGALVRESVEKLRSGPIRIVVNTHHHWDHLGANNLYPEARVVLSAQALESLKTFGTEFPSARGVGGYARFFLPFLRERAFWTPPELSLEPPGNAAAKLGTSSSSSSETSHSGVSSKGEVSHESIQAGSVASPGGYTATNEEAGKSEGGEGSTSEEGGCQEFSWLASLESAGGFTEKDHQLWLGSHLIHVLYLGAGHTGGDVVVYLPEQHTVIVGDLLFNGYYPLIDREAGGSFERWVETLDHVLALGPTYVIPGHGSATGAAELKAFQGYLRALVAEVRRLMELGKSREEIIREIDLPVHSERLQALFGFSSLPLNAGEVFDELSELASPAETSTPNTSITPVEDDELDDSDTD